MKFLKKASLAAAIAAAPFAAQAELVALDDATMSSTTGQAGVTIEIQLGSDGIGIGQVEYKDEGSVLLQNINVKDSGGAGLDITQTIDVDANGNLLIGMSELNGLQVTMGGGTAIDAGTGAVTSNSAVALKSTAGAVTELVNDVNLVLDMGASTTTILNLAETGGNAAAIAALPASAQTGSVAILANMNVEITDLDVGAFGYTADQAANITTTLGGGVALSDAGAVAKTNALIDQYNAQTGSTVANVAAGDTLTAEQTSVVTATVASSSAIGITDVKFYGKNGSGVYEAGNKVNVAQTIWAKGGDAALGGGVYIQLGNIEGALEIGGIEIGGASIGSVTISDLQLAGMTQRIYGH